MIYKIICIAIGSLYLINLLLPVVLIAAGLFVAFWTRDRKTPSWADGFIKLKYGRIEARRGFTWSSSDAGNYWWDKDFMALGGISACLIALVWFGQLAGIVAGAGVLALVVGPRIILDIAHSIRYSFKEREATRISELELKVRNLENK